MSGLINAINYYSALVVEYFFGDAVHLGETDVARVAVCLLIFVLIVVCVIDIFLEKEKMEKPQ